MLYFKRPDHEDFETSEKDSEEVESSEGAESSESLESSDELESSESSGSSDEGGDNEGIAEAGEGSASTMAKEKGAVNPAQAARKAEKQRAIAKGKAAKQAQRTEKLAHRNPTQVKNDIDELRARQNRQGGELKPHERARLSQLEKDATAISKARDKLGDKAPAFRGYGGGKGGAKDGQNRDGADQRGAVGTNNDSVLGKRDRDGNLPHQPGAPEKDVDALEPDELSSATDDDVAGIPMPLGTPPPPSPRVRPADDHYVAWNGYCVLQSAVPLLEERLKQEQHASPPEAPEAKKTKLVHSADAQLRNLPAESRKFVPAGVATKMRAAQSQGNQLLEPEEADKLERQGYAIGVAGSSTAAASSPALVARAPAPQAHFLDPIKLASASAEKDARIEEELAQIEKEMRDAQRAGTSGD